MIKARTSSSEYKWGRITTIDATSQFKSQSAISVDLESKFAFVPLSKMMAGTPFLVKCHHTRRNVMSSYDGSEKSFISESIRGSVLPK